MIRSCGSVTVIVMVGLVSGSFPVDAGAQASSGSLVDAAATWDSDDVSHDTPTPYDRPPVPEPRSMSVPATGADGPGLLATLCRVDCASFYCNYNCGTGHDYLVFGSIWAENGPGGGFYSWMGIGVCVFTGSTTWAKGAYQGFSATWTNVSQYRVRGDGGNTSAGGWDAIRLAKKTEGTFEYCQVPDSTHAGVAIYPTLSAGDSYIFYGDLGGDELWLSSHDDVSAPSASECITNAGYAYGNGDGDWLFGSYYGDTLRGGAGGDLIVGHDGLDYLYGDTGNGDHLVGGIGDDRLVGGSGNSDTLEGGPGSDWLYGDDIGGANTGTGDTCDCSDGSYCHDTNCETWYCDTVCP